MKNIIFDMDGILLDTEKVCMDSWCLVAEQMGIPDMETVFVRCIGGNEKASEKILLDYYGDKIDYPAFRVRANKQFHDTIENYGIPVKKGVKECLAYLKEQGFAIGLASSTRKASVENLLNRAGILEYFQVLATGDMVTHSKPDPEIYLMACEMLGVDPKETYAVEDSYNGIRAAFAAGMTPLMVPDIVPPNEEMEEKSYRILKDLLEVKEFFKAQDRA